MKLQLFISALALSALSGAVHADTHAGYPIQTTPQTGGEGTVEQSDTNAYSRPQGNLSMTCLLYTSPSPRD